MFSTQIPEIAVFIEGATVLLEGFYPLELPHYGEAFGRKVTVLTQYTMCALGYIGTITAVASIALGNVLVTVSAVIFTATALTASIYIRKVYQLVSIEHDIVELKNINASLKITLEQYKNENKDLKENLVVLKNESRILDDNYKKSSADCAQLVHVVQDYEKANQVLTIQVHSLEEIPKAIAQQLTDLEHQVSLIQESTKLVNTDIQSKLEETQKNLAKQIVQMQNATKEHIQTSEYLNNCKSILTNITELYKQAYEALKSAVDAENAINEQFKTWKIAELQASQEQLKQILEKLDITLQDAFKEMDKSKQKGQSASSYSTHENPISEVRKLICIYIENFQHRINAEHNN